MDPQWHCALRSIMHFLKEKSHLQAQDLRYMNVNYGHIWYPKCRRAEPMHDLID